MICSLKISRFIGGNINKRNNQLLIFCDASTKAYATVLYLRLQNGQTNVLFSKMCLIPKKRKQSKIITIPCLELLPALIGITAANFLVKVLEVDVSKRILWTDSQCVLHWLKTKKPLTVFIQNRVKEILMKKDISF